MTPEKWYAIGSAVNVFMLFLGIWIGRKRGKAKQ